MARMKSRWFRFSLRTLLLLITALCVWLGIQVNAARRQREAVAAILKAGGRVHYDYEIVPQPWPPKTLQTGIYGIDPQAKLPGPAWLRQGIGDDSFRTAVAF